MNKAVLKSISDIIQLMTEEIPSSEIPQYRREQVVQIFKKFPEKGINHPDELLSTIPEVTEANMLLDAWSEQEQREAQKKGTPADLEFRLNRDTIFVDAGFSDPDYLDEVARDFLAQDLQEAQDSGLTEISKKIQAKIDEIEAKLA